MVGIRGSNERWGHRARALLALSVACILASVAPGWAATPLAAMTAEQATTELQSEIPPNLTREDVRGLLSRLSDDQVRAILLARLDKQAATGKQPVDRAEGQSLVERAHARFKGVSKEFATVLGARDAIGALPERLWAHMTIYGTENGLLILVEYALFLAVAWFAERYVRRATSTVGQQGVTAEAGALGARIGLLGLRAVMEAIGVVVFASIAVAAMCLVMLANEGASLVFLSLLWAIVLIRLVSTASRAAFAPSAPSLRVLPLPDRAARAIHVRIVVFASVWILSGLPTHVMDDLAFGPREIALVALMTGSFVIATVIYLVWEARAPVARLIRGGQGLEVARPGGFLDALARYWHLLATAYVLVVWLLAIATRLETGESAAAPGFLSLMLIVAVPLADAGLKRLVARYFAPDEEPHPKPVGAQVVDIAEDREFEAAARPTDAASARGQAAQYQAAVLRNLRILLGIVVVVAFAAIWDIDLRALAHQRVGAQIAGALFDVGLTALLAYALWSVVKVAVERHAGGAGPSGGVAAGEGEMGGAGASRIETLLPLFRKFIAITLIIMVVMISLSSLGVNIGPLLAGAGMLGIAIGFGAQTLVKDVISGMFFLLDDAFRMGEYVEIDQISGMVERISVRSLQLRHHNGPVHTLPFGEIRHVTNYSRDYAIMKFEIRLPYDTDINKVRKIIKQTGLEMMRDEALGPMMLAPLKSQGVNRMDDSALIVRCKFTAKPGEQFVLRREAYVRIQKALAEAGIHFAPRRVIVESASPNLPPETLQAAAGSLDSDVPGAGPAKADDRG